MKRPILLFVLLFLHSFLFAQNFNVTFSVDKPSGCVPLSLSFHGEAQMPSKVVSWLWVFGDGDSAFVQNPVHIYRNPGQYEAMLWVTDSLGNQMFNVPAKLIAALPYLDLGKDYLLCSGHPTGVAPLYNDTSVPYDSTYYEGHYTWSTGDTTKKIWVGPGRYSVTYEGCGQTLRDTVDVFYTSDTTKLTLSAPGNWLNGKWDATLHVATPFPRTVLTAMRVNWGDGQRDDYYDTPSLLNLNDFTHSYTKPGTYRAKFSFWTYYNRSACDTVQEILINVPGTQARIGIDSIECRNLLFSDSSITNSAVVKWNWNFGDGTTDTVARPRHFYAADGTYTVKLSITTAGGDTASTTRLLPLFAPQVDLGPDTTIIPGRILTLNAGYPRFSPGARYIWSTGREGPTLMVTGSGTYSVRVYYCDYNTPIKDTIRVIGAPDSKLMAAFGSERTACYTYRFTDTSKISSGYISRWQWSFGDNATDTIQHPVHTYTQPGNYAVRLVVTDNYGHRDTALNFITINTSLGVSLDPDSAYWSGRAVLGESLPFRPGLRYLWSTGATTRTILVTTDGTYWVKVTDTLCSISASDTITLGAGATDTLPIADIDSIAIVNANENLRVNVQFDHTFDSGNVFTVQLLRGTSTEGKVTEEGELTDIAVIPGTSKQLSLSVKIPDTIPCGRNYHIRVVSSAPADSTGWSSKFEVLNMPVATVQQRGDSLFAGKALAYQWYLNNAPVNGAITPYYRARANGKYHVVMNNGGDCRAASSAVDVIITAVTDVNAAGSGVKAFPNPTAGVVYIRFEKPLLKPVTVAVFDAKGNQVYTRLQKDQTDQIDLSALPGGVYYLEITGHEKRKVMRVILQ